MQEEFKTMMEQEMQKKMALLEKKHKRENTELKCQIE